MAKIAIIGSRGIPANYGGFETLAENLVRHLGKKHEFIVYCSSLAYTEKPDRHLNAELRYIPLDANGWQSVPYDIWSMIDAARKADILLVLGVSGCIFLPLLKLFTRKRVLVNLDGLDAQRPKWGKLARTFLKLSEVIAARFADKLVADNDAIKAYIRAEYGKDSLLIEYGGDHALCDLPARHNDELSVVALHKSSDNNDTIKIDFDRYAIGVCRIEPENNIHTILEAFSTADSLPLVFLGNWSISEYGQQLRKKYGHHPKLQLLDPIFESEQLFVIRSNASLYLHGHSSGGTNPSLVESMTLGLPVMAFDVVFNRATTEEKAVYFANTAELVAALQQMESLELAENSKRMLEVARRRYSWATISNKYQHLFGAPGQSAAGEIQLTEDALYGNNVKEDEAALADTMTSAQLEQPKSVRAS